MATYIIGAIVFGIIIAITINLFRKGRKGSGCPSGCDGCPSASNCHKL